MSFSKAVCSLLSGVSLLGLGAPVASAEPPAPKAAPMSAEAAHAPVEIIFTGFSRRADKGATIFVRMTAEVPVLANRVGQRVTYRLSGAKLGVANNANPLPTEHFGPPVSNVALVPFSAGVDLVIDLSGGSDAAIPTYRFLAQGGLATLQVELPPVVL
jgi:hypothetical protein